MTGMSLRDRIGFDGGATRLEDALETAATHAFHYLDFNADRGPNRLDEWSDDRVRSVRDACERDGIRIALHTMSGVNTAEFSPFVAEAVDQYLRANIDLAHRLGCEGVVVHAGFHFSAALEARKTASLERLKRAAGYAEEVGPVLLLENLNFEPDDAEVHYLAHTVEECRLYFDGISSEHFGWAFTVNHANLVPEGIGGFLDAFGIGRIGEVRLADNLGVKEVHLNPGEGNIDFGALFRRLEASGYEGYYTMAFGNSQDKLAAREMFAGYEVPPVGGTSVVSG
jgi:sugar phosphate isomerase/epimerase